MPSRSSLPTYFPVGTKYIIECHGPRVKRYIEYPNGRRTYLPSRKALDCTCLELQKIGIVPNPDIDVIDVKISA